MGKGGCLLAFADMSMRGIRCAFGFICLLVVGGPALIAVGIVMITGPNNFAQKVDTYNTLYDNYTATTLPYLKQSTSSIGGWSNTSLIQLAPNIKGSHDGIEPGMTASLFEQAGVDGRSFQSMSITYKGKTLSWTQPAVPPPQAESTTVYCRSKHGCSASEMRNKCTGAAGCLYITSNHFSCSGHCHQYCGWWVVNPWVCVPVVWKGPENGWERDPNKQACDYPFQQQLLTCGLPSSIMSMNYMIRASNDPYIEAQELTRGSMDFGLTAVQQRLIGVGMLIGGAALLTLLGCCCFAAKNLCCANNHHEHKSAVYGAFGQEYSHPDYSGSNDLYGPSTTAPFNQDGGLYGGTSTNQEPTWGYPSKGNTQSV